MTTEEKYKNILYRERPWDAATLQRHPRMSLQDRVKIFAPSPHCADTVSGCRKRPESCSAAAGQNSPKKKAKS